MAIENPNLKIAIQREREEVLQAAREDPDFLHNKGRIKVKRLTKYDDPGRFDSQFESVAREVATNVVDIDAKIMESVGRGRTARRELVHYTNAAEFMKSPTVVRRLNEARAAGLVSADQVTFANRSLIEKLDGRKRPEPPAGRKLQESDFEYGYYADERGPGSGRVFPVSNVILPSLNNPNAKNALLVDYLDAHRKAWSAYTFNPIARRIPKIIAQFVLSRGVSGAVDSDEHQKVWDDFYKRNKMRQRVKQGLREIVTFGEIFWRYFPSKDGLIVRSLDPSTIWDIVTDEDDIENVKYYHQQYLRMDRNPIPGQPAVPSTMVIRHIPGDEVSHYKVNATSSEKRGRSELFPILGYLLRFKEFLDDRILLNKMRGMFALDVAVTGDASDVNAAEEQFSTPPGPAAVLVHNAGVEVEFKNTSANASDATTDADTILKVIAIGAGISENFLGVAKAQTRAGALISTEPDVKNFEDYQELIEEVLIDAAERVFKAKGLTPKVMEFTFPALAQEDRSAKVKDIAFMESMDYISKERGATMAVREFQITDYKFAREQDKIRRERETDPVISLAMQQAPKVALEPGAAQPPGLGPDLAPNKPGVTQTSGQMGFAADKGGRGLSDTQATLNRTNFTRGGEKTAIKNNRTSGTPLRHSAGDAPKRTGWSPEAREKSLATRRAKAEARKRDQGGQA